MIFQTSSKPCFVSDEFQPSIAAERERYVRAEQERNDVENECHFGDIGSEQVGAECCQPVGDDGDPCQYPRILAQQRYDPQHDESRTYDDVE